MDNWSSGCRSSTGSRRLVKRMGLGDADENWIYLALAVSLGELQLSRSDRVGEFDFTAIVP